VALEQVVAVQGVAALEELVSFGELAATVSVVVGVVVAR